MLFSTKMSSQDAWFATSAPGPFSGSPTTVTASDGGERFVVAWGETLEDVVEYRIAIGRCE